jgi:hypothetical protein
MYREEAYSQKPECWLSTCVYRKSSKVQNCLFVMPSRQEASPGHHGIEHILLLTSHAKWTKGPSMPESCCWFAGSLSVIRRCNALERPHQNLSNLTSLDTIWLESTVHFMSMHFSVRTCARRRQTFHSYASWWRACIYSFFSGVCMPQTHACTLSSFKAWTFAIIMRCHILLHLREPFKHPWDATYCCICMNPSNTVDTWSLHCTCTHNTLTRSMTMHRISMACVHKVNAERTTPWPPHICAKLAVLAIFGVTYTSACIYIHKHTYTAPIVVMSGILELKVKTFLVWRWKKVHCTLDNQHLEIGVGMRKNRYTCLCIYPYADYNICICRLMYLSAD